MDPRFSFRKGYDTDLLILRSLFALNPTTNLPISSSYILTTDGIGGLEWESAVQYLSSALGVNNLPSTLNQFSTNISTNTGILNNYSTNFLTNAISTKSISSGQITASTVTLFDLLNNSKQTLTASNGGLYLNGSPIVAGSGISQPQLTSTTIGLGTLGYISSPTLTSSLVGLGTLGYVSTATLNNLSNYIFDSVRYISTGNLFSTTASLLNYATNFNPGEGISSFVVYGTANFYSTVSVGIMNVYIQDVSTLSTAVGGQFESLSTSLGENQYGWITSSQLQSSILGLGGTGLISTGQLVSTLEGLGTIGYISSTQLGSTTSGIINTVLPSLFTSTTAGLGTANYISSAQLISTVGGLGQSGYLNNAMLTSTVGNLGTAGYISSSQLTSSIIGLGSAGYVSTSQLTSSILGLGGTGLISTGQLTSSIIGLGTTGYVSSQSLGSSVGFLYSTGTYISTGNLISTSIGLLGSFQIVNSSNIYVTGGGILNVTNTNSIVYLSSFLYSTITYKGINGQITASNAGSQMYFSSANLQLDRFSSYITTNSIVALEILPTFLFDKLAYTLSDWNANGSKVPQQIYMSSFVQYGLTGNYLSSQMSQTMMYPLQYDSNTSNTYNQPIKINIPGSAIINTYAQQPYILGHYLPNGRSSGLTNGFSNANVTAFFGSTNSLFLSIQNLP